MSDSEARAADGAVPDEPADGGSFARASTGKHRAPVEAVGPVRPSPADPAPASGSSTQGAPTDESTVAEDQRGPSDKDRGSTADDSMHDEPLEGEPVDDQPVEDEPAAVEEGGEAEHASEPSWWHRSHPTFAGLVGFFSGVLYVIAVPGIYAAVLSWLLSASKAQALFPLVLVALIIPLGMLVPRKTRRFAQFMLLGVVSTAVVIGLTTALVVFVMVQLDK